MMKVLHYVDENRLAWGEAWIQLLKELGYRGVQNHVVCKSGGTLAARVAGAGIPCDTFDVPVSWLAISAWGLSRIIDRVKPDIIHTRLSSAARIGGYWGVRKNIPVIQSVDKYPKAHYHKNADLLLPCSFDVKQHMASIGFPEEKMLVVFNSLETGRYKPDPQLRGQIRRKLRLRDDQLLIIGAGRFVDWKGFDNLLTAYATLLSLNSGAVDGTRLMLVGDGEVKHKLVNLIESLRIAQNVIMPGFVSDIRPFLQAADIFVLSSKTPEPFGIILLEAMASGKACIATRGGGALDMITDKENGWFAELGGVASLSSVLARVTEDPSAREMAASKALERASLFDVAEISAQIIKIYKNILEDNTVKQ